MKLKTAFAVLALIATAGAVKSANAVEVVCVDQQEIVNSSQYAQKVLSEIKQEEKELKAELQKEIGPLQKKLQEIQKQLSSGLLSKEAAKEKRKEAMQIQQQIQQKFFEIREKFQKFAQQKEQELQQLEQAALKALSETLGFKAVTLCRAFIFHTPEVDISKQTAKVIDQLANQKGQK
jgi:Skp family chaperone for outer membrane proteins